MKVFSIFLAFIYYTLFSISCSKILDQSDEDELTNFADDSVSVSFDIQIDFEGTSLKIWINGTYVFSDTLSTSVPLSGPLANFSLKMKRGENEVFVNWINNKIDSDYIRRKSIILGDADKYYIVLEKLKNSITIKVYDHPIFYL